MRTFFVLCEGRAWVGSLHRAMNIASYQSICTGRPAKILVARPGQKMARIVAEAEDSSMHWISSGRHMHIKALKRLISDDA